MAISLVSKSQNDFISPVYNDIVWTFSSNNASECKFRYICDVYVEGVFVTRLKMLPDQNNQGVFKINRILEDYITNTPKANVSGIVSASDNLTYYELEIGEEYDDSPDCNSAVDEYLNLYSTGEYVVFNGALDKEDILSFDPNEYKITTNSSVAKFLTNQPEYIMIGLQEEAELYFFIDDASTLYRFIVTTFDEYGNASNVGYINYSEPSPFSHLNKMMCVGVGPKNLGMEIDNAFINTNVAEYWIIGVNVSSQALTEIKKFKVDRREHVGNKYRFRWLNQFGAYDSYTFNQSDILNYNITNRVEIDKYLAPNFTIQDRGRQTTAVNAKKALTVTSNWLTEEENQWMYSLYISPDVYLQEIQPIYCFYTISGDGTTSPPSNAYLSVGKQIKEGIEVSTNYVIDSIDKTENAAFEGVSFINTTYSTTYNGYSMVSSVFDDTKNYSGGIFYLEDYTSNNIPIIITSGNYEEKKKYKTKNINQIIQFEYSSNLNLQRN